MADYFTQFSEVLPNLTREEEAWLREQLEHPLLKSDDWSCGRNDTPPASETEHLALWEAFDEAGYLGFDWRFDDDEPARTPSEVPGWGRHLWLYAEVDGDPEQLVPLVQGFLKRFRPGDAWSLTYSVSCSKPRVGAFGGGATVVTSGGASWWSAYDWTERQRSAQRSA